jgi:hypothetical protein
MAYKFTKIGKTGTVTSDTTLLEALVKGIDLKLAVRIGILGASGKNTRAKSSKGNDITNAEIGLAHEKGIKSRNLPRRSWLEEPLRDNLSIYFVALGKKVVEKMLRGSYQQAYAELGLVSEIIIQKGFETGGYGKWKPLSPITIARKGSDAILIDTAQLRKSVTSEVIKK